MLSAGLTALSLWACCWLFRFVLPARWLVSQDILIEEIIFAGASSFFCSSDDLASLEIWVKTWTIASMDWGALARIIIA